MISYRENCLTPEIIKNIRHNIGWRNFDDQQLNNAIAMTVYNIVVYEDEQPIAMARLIGDGIYYFICDVAVCVEYQGNGIGTTMLKMLIDYVKKNLEEGQRCSIQLISAIGKEDFYKQFGFKIIPNHQSGHGMQIFIQYEK